MLKVMHLIASLTTGGAETMLRKIIEASTGQTHVVVSFSDIGAIGVALRESGISVYSLDMRSSLHLLRTLIRLALLVRKEQPEVVQTWMYHADFLGGLVCALLRVRVLWGVRTTELPRSGSHVTRLIRGCCARMSGAIPAKVIYAADASRKLHESIGYSKKKSIVIPNGFHIKQLRAGWNRRTEMRSIFGVKDDEIAIGCIGRFHDDKGQRNFLVAASLLIERGFNLKLVMIGRDIVKENKLLSGWVGELAIDSRVVLLGERYDIPACLSSLDLFCLPSRTEGFPNVLGEAMGVGIPCVATDVGDVRIVLGSCGIVVPPGDSGILADGMEHALKWSPTERAARIEAARRRLSEKFSIESTCRMFDQVYRNKALLCETICAE